MYLHHRDAFSILLPLIVSEAMHIEALWASFSINN